MLKSKVKYTRLRPTAELQSRRRTRDDFDNEQFEDNAPIRPPVKPIAVATFLFVIGTLLLVLGSLMLAGVIGENYGDRATPLLVIGGICFLPGLYHVRIAYYAAKGYHGYSYADIAGYDE